MNELEYFDQFQDILKNYHVSEAAKQTIKDTPLVLCSAATASGRNTIIKELLKTGDYYFIISDTTRKPRINNGVLEKTGVEYWFRSEDQMLDDLKNGKLLEAEIVHQQQVSGMSIREIAKAKAQNKIAISDIDRGGVEIVTTAKPDTICLFFLPPSFEEWQRRIDSRGTMSDIEKCRRLRTAIEEFKVALTQSHYWFVVNDNLSETVLYVDKIIKDRKVDPAKQKAACILVEELLKKTNELLEKHHG